MNKKQVLLPVVDSPHPSSPSYPPVQPMFTVRYGSEGSDRSTESEISIGRSQPGQVMTATTYPVHTGQEATALLHALSDGKYDLCYADDVEARTRIHQRPGAPYFVELELLQEEGEDISLLKQVTDNLSTDAAFVMLYVSQLLAPVGAIVLDRYAGGWIDLNDVARKVLGRPRSSQEAEQHRALIWHILKYGARAKIIGQRSIRYYHSDTRMEIPTRLKTPLWTFLGRQEPEQKPLFGEDVVPVRVELVASREWTALTTSPETAQYLPFGEVLGSIPGNKAGGAWARSLGIAFLNYCRRHSRGVLDGSQRPTRQELLDEYPAKVSPYEEVAQGKNPKRVIKYFTEAEAILESCGLITLPKPRSPKKLRRQGWQKAWLRDPLDWSPGMLLRPVVENNAKAQFVKKPRQLKKLKPPKKPQKQAKR